MLVISKKVQPHEPLLLTQLVILYNTVFKNEDAELPAASYLQGLLQKEEIIFFVAVQNNAVVGGLTAYMLP